jgi:hypothetical protein
VFTTVSAYISVCVCMCMCVAFETGKEKSNCVRMCTCVAFETGKGVLGANDKSRHRARGSRITQPWFGSGRADFPGLWESAIPGVAIRWFRQIIDIYSHTLLSLGFELTAFLMHLCNNLVHLDSSLDHPSDPTLATHHTYSTWATLRSCSSCFRCTTTAWKSSCSPSRQRPPSNCTSRCKAVRPPDTCDSSGVEG